MSEPLWSDDAIAEAIDRLGSARVVIYLMRDSYEKCLTEIEARLNGAFPPTVTAEPVVLVDWSQYGQCDFFAIDENGEGYAFSQRPTANRIVWASDNGLMEFVGNFNLNGIDWRQTLTERPNQPPTGVTRV